MWQSAQVVRQASVTTIGGPPIHPSRVVPRADHPEVDMSAAACRSESCEKVCTISIYRRSFETLDTLGQLIIGDLPSPGMRAAFHTFRASLHHDHDTLQQAGVTPSITDVMRGAQRLKDSIKKFWRWKFKLNLPVMITQAYYATESQSTIT